MGVSCLLGPSTVGFSILPLLYDGPPRHLYEEKAIKTLALDPGNVESGWVLVESTLPPYYIEGAVVDNNELLALLKYEFTDVNMLLIECPKPIGMPAASEVFETLIWIGRFIEVWLANGRQVDYSLIHRDAVKLCLCGVARARDKNVNQAIKNRYPAYGGGKDKVKGTKAQPGPLFGVSKHQWPALGVAITWLETGKPVQQEIQGKQKTKGSKDEQATGH